MKNNIYIIIFTILAIFLLAANGCKTTEPSTTSEEQQVQQQEESQEQTEENTEPAEEEQKTEEKKQEEEQKVEEIKQEEEQTIIVFDQEEASKLLDQAKLEIAKAQQMGAEEYSPDKFREALELFAQAEEIYSQKQDFAAYKEIIEKARAMAELAYLEAAEKKYEREKEELLKLRELSSVVQNLEYYKDELINADILFSQAEELKQKGDFVSALNKLHEAKSLYKKIYDSYINDKNYVYAEFPKLLVLQNEMIEKNIKTIYSEDYQKFIEMFNELKKAIDKGDFKAAKEYLQMSYILGRTLIDRYNQAIVIINQTEAGRYLFYAQQAYDIAKEKENTFNDEQKILLQQMKNQINLAEDAFNKQYYKDTINFSKEAMKIYVKLMENNMSKLTTYVVRLIPERRDCLWRIAGYPFIYNNPYLWPLIWIANLDIITNPDLIYPGQVLVIPPLPQ